MKNEKLKFSSPKFWAEVSREVYLTLGESVVPILNGEILPEVYHEVQDKLNDISADWCERKAYHRGFLICENDIWFSIHVQIHNSEELETPKVSIFAILPFVGNTPFVLRVYLDPLMQSQLDVYSPHFFRQYAARAERFSNEARKLAHEFKLFRVYENSNKKRLEEKSMKPLHFFIGLFLSQNWFFLMTDNEKAFSYEEQQHDSSAKKWAMPAIDSVIYGDTKTEDGCPFTMNTYLTCVDYSLLGEDQKEILLPLKEELEKKYMAHIFK